MGIELSGFAYDSDGTPIDNGRTVKLYDRNTTANPRASTTINGTTGAWSFDNGDVTVSSVYQMDVEITDESNVTRYKYDDEIMLQRVDVKDFVLRSGSSNQYVATLIPETLTADATVTIPNETGTVLITDGSGNVGDQTQTQIQELFINETSNANQTIGLTINSAGNQTANISLKGSSVAHGLTTYAETDTYGWISLADGNGGIAIQGVNDTEETNSLDAAVRIRGYQKSNADTASDNTAGAPVVIEGIEHDGSNSLTSVLTADENVIVFKKGAGIDTTTHIFKGDGDIFMDGSNTTTYDDYDDVALLTAWNGVVASEPKYQTEFKDWVNEHKETLEKHNIISVSDNGLFHYSLKGLNSLMVGAIRQLGDKVNKLEEQLALKGAE